MTKCPLCFSELVQDRRCFALDVPGLEAGVDQKLSRHFGREAWSIAQYNVERPMNAQPGWDSLPAVQITVDNDREVPEGTVVIGELCEECHYPVPEGWRQADVTSIAMCGARASGKSLYIATAVKTLKSYLVAHGGSLQPHTEHTQTIYADHYERPLFEQMGIMGATVRAEASQDPYQLHPLIFSIGAMPDGRRRFLVLRDVAGEELEELPADAGHLEFLTRADAIIFMFDPLSVDAIRRRLQDLVPTQARSSGSPIRVLDNVQRLLGTVQRPPRLAIALSKFDVLQQLAQVKDADWSQIMSNAGAGFMREPSHASAYQMQDAELLNVEARSLLKYMGADEIVNKVERPHTGSRAEYRYFVVSALGDSPQGERASKRGISPFRVLDPLNWALFGQRA